jgi:hypothetical protein
MGEEEDEEKGQLYRELLHVELSLLTWASVPENAISAH